MHRNLFLILISLTIPNFASLKKLSVVGLLATVLLSGCATATARVWQKKDYSATKQEVNMALTKCEEREDVKKAHSTVHVWRVLDQVPFVSILSFADIGLDRDEDVYSASLIECMNELGFFYTEEKTDKYLWDKHSNFDISKEEWDKEKYGDPIAFGRTWELIGTGIDKSHYFCDPKTISYSYHIIKFEFRMVDQLRNEYLGWEEVDCARNDFRSFNITQYDKNYRSIGRMPDVPWQSIPPNSLIEIFKKTYCR